MARRDGTGLAGKVAFITGAGRGQGRSHTVRLAEEGADIIAVDICAPIDSVGYALAGTDDLEETARLVEKHGRRVVALQADVRDLDGLRAAFAAGTGALGPCQIVVANAGVMTVGTFGEAAPRAWRDTIDVNLTGAWHTLQVAVPPMVEAGNGGSVILISSSAGLKGHTDGSGGWDAYTAAKHGLVGLMRSYAWFLAPHKIRVNSIHPSGVPTMMTLNQAMGDYVTTHEAAAARLGNAMPVPWLDAEDISAAVAWLASDEARYVTGVTLPVDAGAHIL
ncbi:MAG TPA: mycofactocin-coupled SDR family oxidoreductase [Acidimicrobiales bacterium]|nr:mycofactocin-coupled SDR family oxidoreductase [Acidimicrobiales bacterium]